MDFDNKDTMLKIFLLLIFFLFFVVRPGFTQDEGIEFEGRYWITDLDAEAKAEESGIGTKFDFKSDLGVGDEDLPEARFTWHTGPNSKLRFAYTQVSYGGSRDIVQTIQFEGQSYTAGARVNSEFDLTYLRLGWIWHMLNLTDKIKLGSLAEIKGIIADISLEAPNLSPALSESQDFIGGLPTIGLTLDINPIKKLNLFAEVSGLTSGDYGYFFDAETGVEFVPFENFTIICGYRMIDLEVEYDDDFVNLGISGPFVGATLRF